MDFDERRCRPVYTGALLWQQVKEQSDYCDFTVKQGLWSKRYHECVVCVSPFVQAMIRNTFNEKTKGFLELKLGSPESIDMVMMFLYGKSPKLTIENVSVMMHLAEFLLIPKLKAFCADFINNETKVDEENVEKLLHLSSIFDFEIHALTKYIRQHLPELLGGNQLMTITADTLENMFSDATLSYITADVKFEFIMRWVKRSPEQRKPNLDAIIAGIYLPEVTVNLIKKAKGDKFFEDLQVLNGTESEVGVRMQNVLITNNHFDCEDFWVFDLGQQKWFRLERKSLDPWNGFITYNYDKSTLCLVKKNPYLVPIIRFLNFAVLDELYCTSESSPTFFDSIYILNKVCYTVLNKPEKISLSNETRRSYRKSLSGVPFNFERLSKQTLRPTIFVGAINEYSEDSNLAPLLSLNVNFDVDICVNEAKLVALFSKNNRFFCIYDQQSCKMHKIDVKLTHKDEVSPFKDGFVIHNRNNEIVLHNHELVFTMKDYFQFMKHAQMTTMIFVLLLLLGTNGFVSGEHTSTQTMQNATHWTIQQMNWEKLKWTM